MLDTYKVAYFGLDNFDTTGHLCAIVFNILSIVVLYRIASPLDKYRRNVVIGIAAGVLAVLLYQAIVTFTGNGNWGVLDIDFSEISNTGFAIGGVSLLICFFWYIGGCEICDLIKKKKASDKNVENK
jgi:Kef-type K+ transport system membrane component KefB